MMALHIFRPNAIEGDFLTEVALGNVDDYKAIHKTGEALDCDSGVPTDIWDGADGVTSTDIWVAPTAARIHAIVSSSAGDTSGGSGIKTVMIHGLKTWADTEETTEIVTMAGVTPVNTANSYVIIYRLMGMTFGSTKTNAGIIKATAATDNTITAMIRVGTGQSLMAIFGVPAGCRLVVSHLHAQVLSTTSTQVPGALIVESTVDAATSGERVARRFNFNHAASHDPIIPPLQISGPAIVKMQVTTAAANVQVIGSFDGVLARTTNAEHSSA